MIFFYQGFSYDSSGKVNINPLNYEVTPDDFKMQGFSTYFLYSEANLNILNLMYQKGIEILTDSKKRKKEPLFL